ncbi:hypothetical protein TorRG33x02_265190 [Trema orientale]|uniref:Uncharacterized protein n=1 Tax=Trema orientale TaxID=63057 RepID=A0A2P5D1G7_TREOI|nr:hypothetical protein TorRG33x02_265190 [Trema orientale]
MVEASNLVREEAADADVIGLPELVVADVAKILAVLRVGIARTSILRYPGGSSFSGSAVRLSLRSCYLGRPFDN